MIVDLSDLRTQEINEELDVDSIDDFYNQIKEKNLKIDPSINADDILATIFNEENNETDSLSEFKIKHWVSNRSFGELIEMFENKEIIVPHMQRNFVWDSIKCS